MTTLSIILGCCFLSWIAFILHGMDDKIERIAKALEKKNG